MSVWPNGGTCGVVITVNFDGESVEQQQFPNQLLWGRNSYGRYGAQVGIDRILDTLGRHEVPATFFIPAWDVERYPEIMESIVAAGHEVAGHGYIHESFDALSTEQQVEVLEKCESVFHRHFGHAPSGWRAPGGLMTNDTRELLASRGYLYDSSYCDDDIPYVVETPGGTNIVELPVFATASDSHYYSKRRSPDIVARAWIEEFEAVYETGGLFNLTIHPRGDFGSGRAVRIRSLETIIQHIQQRQGVWLAQCADVARHLLDHSTAC